MDLIDELIELRKAKGVSQATVAENVGCDQSTVTYWERKKTKPSGSARILLQNFVARLKEMPDAERAA